MLLCLPRRSGDFMVSAVKFKCMVLMTHVYWQVLQAAVHHIRPVVADCRAGEALG